MEGQEGYGSLGSWQPSSDISNRFQLELLEQAQMGYDIRLKYPEKSDDRLSTALEMPHLNVIVILSE